MQLHHTCTWWGWPHDDMFADEEYVSGGKKGILQMTAEEFYQQGNRYRQQENWQMALNCYLQAIELDPQSPAVAAKQMVEDILSFYNKDAYNP